MLEIVAQVENLSVHRVLVTALAAHGFHPVEAGDGGLPGLTGLFGNSGLPILVPEEEAADARVLAEELLREMTQ